jgi:hypothetical protein
MLRARDRFSVTNRKILPVADDSWVFAPYGKARKGEMVSSKDQAKKISQGLRLLSKKFFEDFYAKAEEAGRHPSPLQAGVALGRILERATEGEWPPQPPDRPGVSTEVSDLVASRFPQQGYHEAVEAWYRHTPGLEIKKGKPGRKPNVKLAERIWALDAEGKTNREIQETLNTGGENLSLEAVESYLKKRRRARKQ